MKELLKEAADNIANIVLASLCVIVPTLFGTGFYYIFGPQGTDWFRIGS